MNREIKFRAWFVKSETMYSWEDLVNKIGFSKSTFVETELWKPMQYTGVKDKNGVEVYKGDIYTCSIGGDAQDAPILVEDLRSFYEGLDTTDGYMRIDVNSIKVIGNIYQNPRILK